MSLYTELTFEETYQSPDSDHSRALKAISNHPEVVARYGGELNPSKYRFQRVRLGRFSVDGDRDSIIFFIGLHPVSYVEVACADGVGQTYSYGGGMEANDPGFDPVLLGIEHAFYGAWRQIHRGGSATQDPGDQYGRDAGGIYRKLTITSS